MKQIGKCFIIFFNQIYLKRLFLFEKSDLNSDY